MEVILTYYLNSVHHFDGLFVYLWAKQLSLGANVLATPRIIKLCMRKAIAHFHLIDLL